MKPHLLVLTSTACLMASTMSSHAVLYSWDPAAATDDWSTAANWIPNTGVPQNNDDQATIASGGVARIDLNATERIGRLTIGSGSTAGTLTVANGTILDVNETSGGGGTKERVRVGLGAGSTGNLIIEQNAEVTARGSAVFFDIGDGNGAVGNVTVAGSIAPYKSLRVRNGTLTMEPTGNSISAIGGSFNDNTTSLISASGTLAFNINGTTNGLLDLRTESPGGSPLTLDASSNLSINLLGSPGLYSIGQQWTIVSWDASLTGQFSQGTSFTNGQGYDFSVNYAGGAGSNDIVLTLNSVIPEPTTTVTCLLGFGLLALRRRR